MYKILVIEDNLSDQLMIRTALSNHNLYTSKSMNESITLFEKHVFDLVLIDMNLPDGTGIELYKKLKEHPERPNTPMIFLTSNKSVEEIVAGLRVGADDYIIKPFHLAELQARCENAIEKSQQVQRQASNLKCANIEIDLANYEARVIGPNGKMTLDLTSTEFKLLIFFIRNKDRLLNREQILQGVWGESENLSDRTVDARVASLRKKLGSASNQLMSVHGLGYKLCNEPRSDYMRAPTAHLS